MASEWSEVSANIGRTVRFTYFSRHDDTHTPNGERSVGDVDRVVTGILSLHRFPRSVRACILSEESFPNSIMRSPGVYYPIIEAMSFDGSVTQPESRFDGRRNGSYIVELI